VPSVPRLSGQRLPDRRILERSDAETTDRTMRDTKREFYASHALVMFRPFRTLVDLRDSRLDIEPTAWWTAFIRHKDNLSIWSQRVLKFMQEFHVSIVSGKEEEDDDDPNQPDQKAKDGMVWRCSSCCIGRSTEC